MSNLLLLGGLVLGTLAAGPGAGRAGEAGRAPPAGAAVRAADEDFNDVGPYEYLTDAVRERDHWRNQGYGANVITGADGYYYVRVFTP